MKGKDQSAKREEQNSMIFQFSAPKDKTPQTETLRQNFDRILETMRESVLIINSDMRIVRFNKSAREAFGREDESLNNKRLSEVIRDLSLHEAFRNALSKKNQSSIKLEVLGNRRRIYKTHIAPFELDGAEGAIGFFYDITKVEHLERVRQEFLSNISHELRTPLTSIMAFVETLEDGAVDDREHNRRFLGVIRKNAERMHRLIDDISELSMIESGTIKIRLQKRNLHSVVEEVFTNLSAKAFEGKIQLINDVNQNITVCADIVRLEQMLTNLIDNAIKFTGNQGVVTVSHQQTEGKDVISVTDTGEGISGDHLERIFERFYRTDRARSREIGRHGFGLAIVKHLTRLHSGKVSVKSALGRGSTFFIELPNKSTTN